MSDNIRRRNEVNKEDIPKRFNKKYILTINIKRIKDNILYYKSLNKLKTMP